MISCGSRTPQWPYKSSLERYSKQSWSFTGTSPPFLPPAFMVTLASWSEGSSSLPLNSLLISSHRHCP